MSFFARNYKIGVVGTVLGICFVIVALFAYSQILTQQTNVRSLETEKNYLQNQVAALSADKTGLENQVATLENQVATLSADKTGLENQINAFHNVMHECISARKRLVPIA